MCKDKANVPQYQKMLKHMEDQITLDRRFTHELFHTAKDAGLSETQKTLGKAQALLDEVRNLFEEAQEILEREVPDDGVTVELL